MKQAESRVSPVLLAAASLLLVACCAVAAPCEESVEAPQPTGERAAPTADTEPPVEAEPPRPEPAIEKELAALLDRVEAARTKVKTLKADVTFHRLAALLEIDEIFTGDLLFKKPRLLRMELAEREGKRKRVYVVGEKYAWIYRPDKKLAERYKLDPVDEDAPLKTEQPPSPFEYGLTHGIHKLLDSFDMRIAGAEKIDDSQATIVEVLPRKSKKEKPEEAREPQVKFMFWIDDKTALPVRVREFTSRGEVVETYTLSNVRVNPRRILPLFGDPFEFDPPDDVEVVTYGEEDKSEAGR